MWTKINVSLNFLVNKRFITSSGFTVEKSSITLARDRWQVKRNTFICWARGWQCLVCSHVLYLLANKAYLSRNEHWEWEKTRQSSHGLWLLIGWKISISSRIGWCMLHVDFKPNMSKHMYSLVSAKKRTAKTWFALKCSVTELLFSWLSRCVKRPSNHCSFRRGRNKILLTNGTRPLKLERGRNLQTVHWWVVNSFSSSCRKLFCP